VISHVASPAVLADGTNNFLIPNGTFFFELICFIVILFILGKWAIPYIAEKIDERQEIIRKQFQDAEDAKARLEAAEKEYTEALAETRREASRLREQAQAERADIVAEARGEAQAQVAEMLEAAEARLATERQQTILALRNEVGELAMTLAERIVHDSLHRDARQRKLVADFIAGVDAAGVDVTEVAEPAGAGPAESG
jgi:F-type H+-transporting ATPase subunit b